VREDRAQRVLQRRRLDRRLVDHVDVAEVVALERDQRRARGRPLAGREVAGQRQRERVALETV
jgi:hypothetical protein